MEQILERQPGGFAMGDALFPVTKRQFIILNLFEEIGQGFGLHAVDDQVGRLVRGGFIDGFSDLDDFRVPAILEKVFAQIGTGF